MKLIFNDTLKSNSKKFQAFPRKFYPNILYR